MIISHKHKFIFIKTAKTAGTSIEIALSKICGENDVITPISENDENYRKELGYRGKQNYNIPYSTYSAIDVLKMIKNRKRLVYYNHISAEQVKKRISPEIWNSYYKFCFERNPFDKFISFYYWCGGEKVYPTIKNFIDAGMSGKVPGFDLYTIDSFPVVDKIYKFEEISEAIDDINQKLNLDDKISLPEKKAKGQVRVNKKHYSKILTEYEKKWISKVFAREIAFFNYEF